jgi:predicted metal-dependent HD superfamily phosphohydrolase
VNLTDRWTSDWHALGTSPPSLPIRDALLARYAEPHRAYHTLQHLEECFAQLDRSRDLATQAGEVAIAVWFHDAVYDTHASDNEVRSAVWASEVVREAGGAGDVAERVRGLILATRHESEPAAGDATLLVDIDLAILGAGESRFAEYEEQIRREYAWVPAMLFRATRARILRGFLARPRIYGTPRFHEWYEVRARANLQHSLDRLGG